MPPDLWSLYGLMLKSRLFDEGDLVGTWFDIAKDGMYETFTADGILQTSASGSGVDAECSYSFEGANLVLKEISALGLPSCGARIGTYQAELLCRTATFAFGRSLIHSPDAGAPWRKCTKRFANAGARQAASGRPKCLSE
jgi:hypothetical protein